MSKWDGNESSCSCDCGFDIPKGGHLDALTVGDITGIANLIYPVGSIYMSINPVDPSTLFGGEWEQIEERFLLAASSAYPVESTGGATAHQHTSPNGYNINNKLLGMSFRHGYSEASVNGSFAALSHAVTEGSGQYGWKLPKTDIVSHMPPYLAVYMWKRTA